MRRPLVAKKSALAAAVVAAATLLSPALTSSASAQTYYDSIYTYYATADMTGAAVGQLNYTGMCSFRNWGVETAYYVVNTKACTGPR